MKTRFPLLLAFCLILLSHCKPKAPQITEIDDSVARLVIAHSEQQIDIEQGIFIRLSKSVTDAIEKKDLDLNSIISTQPKIIGGFEFKDQQLIKLKDKDALEFGRTYNISLDFTSLDLESENNTTSYQFSVSTRELFLFVDEMDLVSEPVDDNKMKAYLTINTNAPLKESNYNKYLSLQYGNETLTLGQYKQKDLHQFTFVSETFSKSEKNQRLKLKSNYTGLNDYSYEINVPAQNSFTVLDCKMEDRTQKHFQIYFSEVLAEQNFFGLVKLENYNGSYSFKRDQNILNVYLDDSAIGEYLIKISDKLINRGKLSLGQLSKFYLSFEDLKPAIRSNITGVIVPDNDAVIFPFEAVGLDSIELKIFKVFDNNVLDFLRYNNINSFNENTYLGRTVHNETIALGELNGSNNANQWVRYALDLKEITDIDKGAIYQVSIGFRKRFTNYKCEDSQEIAKRSSSFDYNGFYNHYNYYEREDPCAHSYYTSDKILYRNLISSNIGIIAKKGRDKTVHVYTTDLNTNGALANVDYKLYDKQQQLLTQGQTDAQGYARIELKSDAHYLTTEKSGQYGFLKLEDVFANALTEFDVTGVENTTGLNAMIYGERDVWRPGDTMYLSVMLLDSNDPSNNQLPLRLSVKDNAGKLRFNQITTDNRGGIYTFSVPTEVDAPTGNWRAYAETGNYITSKSLKVETIKPNRIKVDVAYSSDLVDISDAGTTLKAQWLHGADASDLKALVDVKYSHKPFDKRSDYEFSDPSRKISSDFINILDKRLDGNGEAVLNFKLQDQIKPAAQLKATIRSRVFEKSGNYSEDYSSVGINPYDQYVGVKLPISRWGEPTLDSENNEAIKFISVDKNGNPLSSRQLKIGIYRARWNWWYNNTNNGIYRFNSSEHIDAEMTKTITTNSRGLAEWTPSLEEYATYLVRVCDEESGHCSGQLFYTGSSRRQDNESNRISYLKLSADKDKYEVNESVELTVESSANSRMLISVENNSEVLNSFWVDSQGDETKVNVPVSRKMLPNAYVHVTMLQDMENENDLPLRMYGVLNVDVSDKSKQLEPIIDIAETIRPNKLTEFKVSEKEGKSMSYTLALVDEGLLDITNFSTPDPLKHFYAKQALGVMSWDLFDYVLNKHGLDIEKIISVGGDGEVNKDPSKPSANRFQPVVKFLGSFDLAPKEANKHSVEIPNYIGSLRLMVIAKSADAFGQLSKRVYVKDPLMALMTLPRALTPGETVQLPANIFAYNDDIKNVELDLQVSSNLKVIGEKKDKISFARAGDKLKYFALEVTDKLGVAELNLKAESGRYSARDKIEIDVRNPSPPIKEVNKYVVAKGESIAVDFQNIGLPLTNKAYLEVSTFPDFNFEDRLKYLIRYPYGCVEQTVSSVFPQLYINDLRELDSKSEKRINYNIKSGIRRLTKFQRTDGGLSYWPGSQSSNLWGSNYAFHFMIEAEHSGYTVPISFMENLVKFQARQARLYTYDGKSYNQITQAYRLFLLAKYNRAEIAAMNNLRLRSDISHMAKFLLAGAYQYIGQEDIASDLIKNVSTEIQDYRELSYTYGSSTRDRALILHILQLMGDEQESLKIARDIADQLSSGRWFSTQTTSVCLMALSSFVKDQEDNDLKYSLKFDNSINDKMESNATMDFIELSLNGQNEHRVNLENTSEGPLFVRLVNQGQKAPGPLSSVSSGLSMNVLYHDLDGKPIEISSLTQGQDFKAIITIANTSPTKEDYEELVLNHTLPTGWEIQNLRLSNLDQASNANFDYQDIRDDAVYTFFDLRHGKSKTFEVGLTATYGGRFYMPDIQCEAMYDESIMARKPGSWIQIKSSRN